MTGEYVMTREYQAVGFSRLVWWIGFAATIFALSKSFETFKTFTLHPGLENGLLFLGALGLFAIALAILVYDGYAKDKAKGKVVKTFGPFEWLYSRQYGDSDDKGDDGCQD